MLAASLRKVDADTDLRLAVKECITQLAAGRPEQASRRCNAALQLEAANSHLHLLNALVYHTMALDGDASKSDLAEQGYRLALQFDASNWQAHYFLGMLYFERRRWTAAQDEFAEALLFEPGDADCLAALAAASYQARDPATAASALNRISDERKRRPELARTAAVTYAAVGDRVQAERWMDEASRGAARPGDARQVQDRVRHWLALYERGARAPEVPPASQGLMQLAQAAAAPAPGAPPAPPPPPLSVDPGAGGIERSMVLIDVVMLKMEDTVTTRKGVNLLSSLNIQFGGPASAALSRVTQHVNDVASGGSSGNTTVTRAITIPALNYSLNIVNSNSNLNEVLARPTIAALNGVKSEFFSGTEINAAVVSSGVNSGGAAVQIQKEIGVKLGVTPQFLGERKVRLLVEAQRTFVKPPNSDINFTYKIETSKINVASNVVLDFGETLVLGGLSEKETSRIRDGVPILQDIPGLQYLFSRQDTSEFQRSVIMLITPRDPYYTYRPDEVSGPAGGDPAAVARGGAEGAFRDDPGARQLRARYGDWFAPYPSLESVFNHLGKTGLYREFRTGDVNLERWDRLESTYERLRQSLEFLYF